MDHDHGEGGNTPLPTSTEAAEATEAQPQSAGNEVATWENSSSSSASILEEQASPELPANPPPRAKKPSLTGKASFLPGNSGEPQQKARKQISYVGVTEELIDHVAETLLKTFPKSEAKEPAAQSVVYRPVIPPSGRFRFDKQGPVKDDPKQFSHGGECITSSKEVESVFSLLKPSSIPGRTQALITILLFWSVLLSVFHVVFILYPLFTGFIDVGLFILPKFKNSNYAREVLRAAIILGEWNLIPQTLHNYVGPAGILMFGFAGIVLSAREMGMVGNAHRFLRRENPFHFAVAVFGFVLSSQTVTLSGQWTIQRYAPPFCRYPLHFATCVIPRLLAIYLTSGVQFSLENSIRELMMPVAVLSSTVGISIAFLFALVISQLRECLPSDGVFVNRRFFIAKTPRYWAKFICHPVVWVNVLIHGILWSVQLFWIASIPAVYQGFNSAPYHNGSVLLNGQSKQFFSEVRRCYERFLIFDGVGRYVLPFFCDFFFGPELTRLDVLLCLAIPLFFLNAAAATGILSFAHFMSLIHWNAGALALISAYAVSVTRATIDNFFLTSVLTTAHTAAIVLTLIITNGTYMLHPHTVVRIAHGLVILALFGIVVLWIHYRDFPGDAWGYPQSKILGRVDQYSSLSQTFIPTAMIPLWAHGRPEQEKIMRNYYRWNERRILPSEIEEDNVKWGISDKLRADFEREQMREVRERIVL